MVKERKESEELSSSDESLKQKKVVVKPVQEKWTPKQVFVSGLPYETTEEQLKEFFGESAKDIGNIKLPKYQDSSRCIGYAHVLLNTLNSYESALSKNGSKLGSRYLDIKPAEG